MATANVVILEGSDESFQDNRDASRTVEYVSLTLLIDSAEVLKCTGVKGVLGDLTQEQRDALRVKPRERKAPVEAVAELELRPKDNGRDCRPRVLTFTPAKVRTTAGV